MSSGDTDGVHLPTSSHEPDRRAWRPPSGWYPCCASTDLPPGGMRPFSDGEHPGLLFRSSVGTVAAVGRRCRHRGADLLALGTVTRGGVMCGFHGWCTSSSGEVAPPGEHQAGFRRGSVRTRSWACVEALGVVWTWLGSDRPPSWELAADVVDLTELVDGGSHRLVAERTYDVGTRHTRVLENTLDPWHLRHVHGAAEVPALDVAIDGHRLHVEIAFSASGGGGRTALTWIGPGFEVLHVGDDLALVQLVFAFPTSACTTTYRTEIWAPVDARADVVDAMAAAQLHALDQDVHVWNSLPAEFRSALLPDERRLDDVLTRWLRADGLSTS